MPKFSPRLGDERVRIWMAKLEGDDDVAFVFFDLVPLRDKMAQYAKERGL